MEYTLPEVHLLLRPESPGHRSDPLEVSGQRVSLSFISPNPLIKMRAGLVTLQVKYL
jgi:hypothetical protein